MDLLIVNVPVSCLLIAFIITGNVRIWNAILGMGLIILPYYLLQDSEYYQLVQ